MCVYEIDYEVVPVFKNYTMKMEVEYSSKHY
jgi:hypothetical protein